MSKLPNAGVGNSNINVFFESTVTANYYAHLIVHSTTCNKRHIYYIVCAQTADLNPLVKFVCKTALKSLFRAPPVYHDLSTRYHWPVILWKTGWGENRHAFPVTDSFRPLGAPNKNVTHLRNRPHFLWVYAGCWENTRKACKSRAEGFSSVLPTS